jgi:hypothetical protein
MHDPAESRAKIGAAETRAPGLARALLTALVLLLVTSCEEGGPLFPDTGTVEVIVEGQPPPQGGYTVTLDRTWTRTITQLQVAARFEDVPSGQKEILLSGIAPGCEAVDNPRFRNLQAGGIVRTTFIVDCN